MNEPGVIFAGGGTGGHIYPGLAIAEELRRVRPGVRTLFICSARTLDADILSRHGHAFLSIPARPLSFRPGGILAFARTWGASVRESLAAIESLRANGRVLVVALGGYVSAPVARAARLARADLSLVNLDAKPGKANRWIARFASRTFTSAPIAEPHARGISNWINVRPIVRRSAQAGLSTAECRSTLARQHPALSPTLQTLMVTGGSQGAQSINRFLLAFVKSHPGAFVGWQVLHQCGPGPNARRRTPDDTDTGTDALTDAYERAGIPAVVEPFVHDMGLWWGAADAAVSRAGAGAVAEAWANRVPTLFLPYPYHRDEHQRLNAQPLVAANAALLARDHVEPEPNLLEAGSALRRLLTDAEHRRQLDAALARLGPADGAASIAHVLSAALGPLPAQP